MKYLLPLPITTKNNRSLEILEGANFDHQRHHASRALEVGGKSTAHDLDLYSTGKDSDVLIADEDNSNDTLPLVYLDDLSNDTNSSLVGMNLPPFEEEGSSSTNTSSVVNSLIRSRENEESLPFGSTPPKKVKRDKGKQKATSKSVQEHLTQSDQDFLALMKEKLEFEKEQAAYTKEREDRAASERREQEDMALFIQLVTKEKLSIEEASDIISAGRDLFRKLNQ
jgi:hypothetical protein